MNYVLFKNGKAVHLTSESPWTGTPVMKEFVVEGAKVDYDKAEPTCSPHYKSFAQVEKLAEELSTLTGTRWIPFDDGPATSHRFGAMELPKVGDEVSYGFNGDYYPCGKIVRITAGFRIYTEDDSKPEGSSRQKLMFNRRKQTSGWKMKGGTWSLVKGIHDERNPSF